MKLLTRADVWEDVVDIINNIADEKNLRLDWHCDDEMGFDFYLDFMQGSKYIRIYPYVNVENNAGMYDVSINLRTGNFDHDVMDKEQLLKTVEINELKKTILEFIHLVEICDPEYKVMLKKSEIQKIIKANLDPVLTKKLLAIVK